MTGFDRRTIKSRLTDVEFLKDGTAHLYDTLVALPALYLNRSGGGVHEVYDLQEERARLAHHQANNEGIKEDAATGELYPVAFIVEQGAGIIAAAKVKLLSVHNRIASQFPSIPQEAIDEIEQTHLNALSELENDGLPQASVERIEEIIASMEAAAESDD